MSRKAIIAKSVAKDLDDPATQAEILAPLGVEVTIGGKPVRLYPLSGRAVRELTGLTQQIFAAAFGDGPIEMRVSGVLMEHRYLSRFIPLLAAATFATPKDITPEQHAAVSVEVDEATASASGATELATAFATMVEQNDITAGLGGEPAKKEA